ncbi:MAG: DUF357 domain-containing protein [Candidatus Aenigmarchaeota archaeon]|nr:DUF357 domain-containing protein [Candidatus Aenigmarchaeota archaeon]
MKSENPTDTELKKQTLLWLKKAEEKISNIKKNKDKTNYILKNAQCYIKDANYFLEKKDYIRSFEAIIWVWAFLEIGENCNLLLF